MCENGAKAVRAKGRNSMAVGMMRAKKGCTQNYTAVLLCLC